MTKQLLIFTTLILTSLLSLPTWGQQQYRPSNNNRGYNSNAYSSGYNSNNNRNYNSSNSNYNSRPAYATYGAAYRNEVGASTTFGEISSASSITVINLSGSYKNMVTRNSAFGAILNVAAINGNGSNNTYIGLWGTYSYFFNTNWNTANSMFVEPGIGYVDTALANQGHANIVKSDRQLSWELLVGKNFPIFDKVRFSPKAGVQKIGSTDMAILIIPVNVTLAF